MDKIAELTAYTEYLVRFGFLGVAVFLILIVAPLVQGLLKSPVATKATLATGGLFLILFGVINLIRLTFPSLLPQPVAMFKGMVQGIPTSTTVAIKADLPDADDDRPFMKWEHDRVKREVKNFPFVFLSSEAPKCLTISVQSDAADAGNIGGEPSIFNLPIPSDLRWTPDNALYARSIVADGRMRLEYSLRGGNASDARRFQADPAGDDEASCQRVAGSAGPLFQLISTAFAGDAQLDLKSVASRLSHADAIVRRDMRVQLSRQGSNAFDTILPLLQSGDYRLQLGALAAVAGMAPEIRARLPAPARSAASALLSHSDRTMRETAQRALSGS